MLDSHSPKAHLFHLEPTISTLFCAIEIGLPITVALRKVKVARGRMSNDIINILCNFNESRIGPKTKKLLSTTLSEEKNARSIAIDVTVNDRHVANLTRKKSHLLLSSIESRFLRLSTKSEQEQQR